MNNAKMIQNQEDPQRGFSLIEVLLAIFILGIVSITLISVFIYGFNVVFKTRQVTLATQIAQEQVELVRNLNYNEILLLGSSYSHDSLSDLVNGTGTQAIENGPGDDIKKLTISVTWDFRGANLRKDIVTFVTREGVNKK
ncbi:prepilin-type N-terminal cleavage/methylation domain-containing protein [Acidobacteriota bacterium]